MAKRDEPARRSELRRLSALLGRLADEVERAGRGGDAEVGAGEPPPTGSGAELVAGIERRAGELAEAAQGASERASRLGAALQSLPIGVVVSDRSGACLFRNSAAGAYAGAGGVLVERAVAELLERARHGAEIEQPLELFSPQRRTLSIRAVPLGEPAGSLGAAAVVEDVSERRRIDAVRRDFVANVSHELKTPVGALSLLAETLDGEEDPEIIAVLAGRVGAEAERLGRIIDELLDLSRIEAQEAPESVPVEVEAVLADASRPLRAVAEAAGIDLQVDRVDPDVSVLGERRDLVSAVSNLIDNAIKYSERGSQVRVAVGLEADLVRIDVSDQGIGIPAGDRERIFERFYRVDRARSRLTGGTGLGLSIVRHVVANHGGEVRVSSQEGEGSTFSLLLPVLTEGEVRGTSGGSDG